MIDATKATQSLPPMRGIKQAIAEIKEADPCTALTEKALRRLITDKTIPSVKVGRKYLVNMEVLFKYLYSGTVEAEHKSLPKIRTINE